MRDFGGKRSISLPVLSQLARALTNRLVDLHSEDLGLNEADGLSIDADEALAFLAERGGSSGCNSGRTASVQVHRYIHILRRVLLSTHFSVIAMDRPDCTSKIRE